MKNLGYANVDVMGGTGPVVVGPSGREAVKPQSRIQAGAMQGLAEDKHKCEVAHCVELVKRALSKKPPSPKDLADVADQVAVKVAGFYETFMSGLKPFLKSDAKAYATFR